MKIGRSVYVLYISQIIVFEQIASFARNNQMMDFSIPPEEVFAVLRVQNMAGNLLDIAIGKMNLNAKLI